MAYIETANLDGESSLKIRHSFYKLSKLIFEGGTLSLSIFSGMVIKCEKPNNRMFQFEGSISMQGEGKLEVDETQILLRGATLRHTEWVLGAVVFTGMDTKLMQNMNFGSHKVINRWDFMLRNIIKQIIQQCKIYRTIYVVV